MQAKVVLERKRRRHSEEFRAEVVAACRQPGVSVAAVALAHGLNANLVRRWIKESVERLPVTRRPMANRVVAPLTVVPVSIEASDGRGDEAIRVDIRKAGTAVQLAWPATRVAELSGLLKDLLR
jgi:transposase-like protein